MKSVEDDFHTKSRGVENHCSGSMLADRMNDRRSMFKVPSIVELGIGTEMLGVVV